MSTVDRDCLHRFVFDQHNVRGELVHLNASFEAALANHPYDDASRRVLGHALAAAALLTSILKFDGKLTLQLQGEGSLRLLVAQCTSRLTLRGLVHMDDGVAADAGLGEIAGNGRLVITIEPRKGQRYQGIVPLEGDSVAACLEQYFARSEQLPTRLWLACDENSVVGMMLQKMPDEPGAQIAARATTPAAGAAPPLAGDPDAWNRLTLLAGTITDDELLSLADVQILHRLFHEEDVRLFDRDPVSFRCTCSRARIAEALQRLGETDLEDILRERGKVSTTCEFCNKRYVFDGVDVAALFQKAASRPSDTQH
jgi:molecular chaperone Hsp33